MDGIKNMSFVVAFDMQRQLWSCLVLHVQYPPVSFVSMKNERWEHVKQDKTSVTSTSI